MRFTPHRFCILLFLAAMQGGCVLETSQTFEGDFAWGAGRWPAKQRVDAGLLHYAGTNHHLLGFSMEGVETYLVLLCRKTRSEPAELAVSSDSIEEVWLLLDDAYRRMRGTGETGATKRRFPEEFETASTTQRTAVPGAVPMRGKVVVKRFSALDVYEIEVNLHSATEPTHSIAGTFRARRTQLFRPLSYLAVLFAWVL